MSQVYSWSLDDDEVELLDSFRFSDYPQSPTYYSSAGCPNSFGVSDHPTASACSLPSAKMAT